MSEYMSEYDDYNDCGLVWLYKMIYNEWMGGRTNVCMDVVEIWV